MREKCATHIRMEISAEEFTNNVFAGTAGTRSSGSPPADHKSVNNAMESKTNHQKNPRFFMPNPKGFMSW